MKLTKVRKLLVRQGVKFPYSTLHRFATQELRFGRKASAVPGLRCTPFDGAWLAEGVG